MELFLGWIPETADKYMQLAPSKFRAMHAAFSSHTLSQSSSVEPLLVPFRKLPTNATPQVVV
jgi:hypothetical protein